MPSVSHNYVFCADYSALSSCLLAIQQEQAAGLYQQHPKILDLLNRLDNDLLKKLYNRTLTVLGIISGALDQTTLLRGDFEDEDFAAADFQTSYLDHRLTGYSFRLQAVLNIFTAFCGRGDEISQDQHLALAEVFLPVLDLFSELKELLISKGFLPCGAEAGEAINNPAALNLQVAGSDGSDGIPQGILLRWMLRGELGHHHIPQGKLGITSADNRFLQTQDFVHVDRTPYINPVIQQVDFTARQPIVSFERGRWSYMVYTEKNSQALSSLVHLSFLNRASYLEISSQFDLSTDFRKALQAYSGLLEISVQDKAAFAIALDLSAVTAGSTMKMELISATDDAEAPEAPSMREEIVLSPAGTSHHRYQGENILKIRLLQTGNGVLQGLSFETYQDFMRSRLPSDWSTVGGGFGLSLHDQEVFDRLESPGTFDIDQRWPQYRDGISVRVANYQDKWRRSTPGDPSLRSIVEDYLHKSVTDSRAETEFFDQEFEGQTGSYANTLSYIDLLNLQAMDFHQARMLGLGHIDTTVADPTAQHIYRVRYRNRLSPDAPGITDLFYLSLPVNHRDSRQAERPVMRAVQYTLADQENPFLKSFDSKGYNTRHRVRLVNIGRSTLPEEITSDDFFFSEARPQTFDYVRHTRSVFYGLEYRRADQQEFVLPYITQGASAAVSYHPYHERFSESEPVQLDETLPLLDDENSLFVHFETQEGIHHYAIYGIDIFSRSSALSDEQATDETAFSPDSQLMPPSDIAVQYIQPEEELVFTSLREQAWLQKRNERFSADADTRDTALTRLTFNWQDILDVSGLPDFSPAQLKSMIRADHVNVLFKPQPVLEITATITAVISFGVGRIRLLATGYELLDGSKVKPVISSDDYSKFKGSLLTTEQGQFNVLGLNGTARGLFIDVEPATETVKIDEPAVEQGEVKPGLTSTTTRDIWPLKGSRLHLAENLAQQSNWRVLKTSIPLVSLANLHEPVIETLRDQNGKETRLWAGGIHAPAQVTPFRDAAGAVVPGYFSVRYADGVRLPDLSAGAVPYDDVHPEANKPGSVHPAYVEWYNGKIRLPSTGIDETGTPRVLEDKKVVDVVSIKSLAPLELLIVDPAYDDQSNALVLSELSGGVLQPVEGVNYHPGYRAYLFAEPELFDSRNILPSDAAASHKNSLLALQAEKTLSGNVHYNSPVSMPAILMALHLQQSLAPERPVALMLKVRPDATRKAAFSMDTRMQGDTGAPGREPFGLMFYRTHHIAVLNSLYLPETIDAILQKLSEIPEDRFFADRWLSLLSVEFDAALPGRFRTFGEGTSAYGFPVPDKPGVASPGASASTLKALYQEAIRSTLLPLNDQVIMTRYLNDRLPTKNTPPVIRSLSSGALLEPDDENFDAFPMVRRLKNPQGNSSLRVRFTDYTLSASSRFLYFYAATEVTNKLVPGPLSPFAGPVTVLHTLPAEEPIVMKVKQEPVVNAQGSATVGVTFVLSPFNPGDPISKVRIYRAESYAQAERLSLMQSFKEIPIQKTEDGLIEATDDFSDISLPPLGETIYYRLAFIRTIDNEFDEQEDVLSDPSEMILVNVVDMFNPKPPKIEFDPQSNRLSWKPTANKGTYYLFKQNSRGNWQRHVDPIKDLTNEEISLKLEDLSYQDEDGNAVYHRFKLKVENRSGLFNLSDEELTIPND